MDKTIICTCGGSVSALIDQVLDLSAVTICQCRCGEVVVMLKPARTHLRRPTTRA